jgi:hypothetical protein
MPSSRATSNDAPRPMSLSANALPSPDEPPVMTMTPPSMLPVHMVRFPQALTSSMACS